MSSVWEYFTPEQQEKLKKNIEQLTSHLGPEELKRMRKEGDEIISKLRIGLETGIPSDDPDIVSLAKRLAEGQAKFNDGDPEIESAIERFHVENPDQKDHGIDLELYRYIEKAKS
ncbi:TipAS antibiotic-recognition domain-containing protein [Pseudalkalibacillus decolorationis]|uniref:TipAS antibiotic-recognition domain-containing protein n=1 Tax=Pseudalkalibacillus decolorationis TaxID=163879 RepID=UPI0021474F23|nr:TipAS antibiotic-recognition domain-containing protein [Pseudalkalibacillus decolorationis]